MNSASWKFNFLSESSQHPGAPVLSQTSHFHQEEERRTYPIRWQTAYLGVVDVAHITGGTGAHRILDGICAQAEGEALGSGAGERLGLIALVALLAVRLTVRCRVLRLAEHTAGAADADIAAGAIGGRGRGQDVHLAGLHLGRGVAGQIVDGVADVAGAMSRGHKATEQEKQQRQAKWQANTVRRHFGLQLFFPTDVCAWQACGLNRALFWQLFWSMQIALNPQRPRQAGPWLLLQFR